MTAPRSLLAQLFDWQVLRYGDSPETRAALAYWRERGWGVDDRDDQFIDVRISAFQAGYRVAAALSRLGGPQEPEKEPKIKT